MASGDISKAVTSYPAVLIASASSPTPHPITIAFRPVCSLAWFSSHSKRYGFGARSAQKTSL